MDLLSFVEFLELKNIFLNLLLKSQFEIYKSCNYYFFFHCHFKRWILFVNGHVVFCRNPTIKEYFSTGASTIKFYIWMDVLSSFVDFLQFKNIFVLLLQILSFIFEWILSNFRNPTIKNIFLFHCHFKRWILLANRRVVFFCWNTKI